MQVFISWSGDRSRAIAEALRTWLPRVIQSVQPWMSQEDISAGSRWLSEVSSLLDRSQIGILCVTPENQHNPWLQFEAGALSKSLDQSRVCPLLFDMTPGQLSGPITQFQSQTLDQAGVLRVLTTLNSLSATKLPESELPEILAVWWPRLAQQLASIGPASTPQQARSMQDQLDEILSLAREQIRRENIRLEANRNKDAKFEEIMGLMDQSMSAMGSFQTRFGSLINSLLPVPAPIGGTTGRGPDVTEQFLRDASSGVFPPGFDLTAMEQVRNGLTELHEDNKRTIDAIMSPPDSDVQEGK